MSFEGCLMRRQQKFGRETRSLYLANGGVSLSMRALHSELTKVNDVLRILDFDFILFYSGSSTTQIGFVPVEDRDRKLVADTKIVPYETVAIHRPLICTLKPAPPKLKQSAIPCNKNRAVTEDREGMSCDLSPEAADSYVCRGNS